MVVSAFLLTERVPAATADVGVCDVGKVWDGRLTSRCFPYEARFGALVELMVMPGDSGEADVGLVYASEDEQFEVPRASGTVRMCNPNIAVPVFCPLDVRLTLPVAGFVNLAVTLDGEVVPHTMRPIVAALG